jgi:hypothetical protein
MHAASPLSRTKEIDYPRAPAAVLLSASAGRFCKGLQLTWRKLRGRFQNVCTEFAQISHGLGSPVVALTYHATVDVPARFRKSKSVGAVFGLTCSKYQSGEIDRSGRISRCGDEMMRVMLYEAAWSG